MRKNNMAEAQGEKGHRMNPLSKVLLVDYAVRMSI